jgi:GntR family negative regulator for fad regulon and positive regulator of fabA
MNQSYPLKPAEFAEQKIIFSILEKRFPVNTNLPPERELAVIIGVTRPTLREALQRLARDGWIEIHQGKSTRVKDYLKEGNLNVLSTLSNYQQFLPDDFVIKLLQVRLLLSPTYTFLAIQNNPKFFIDILTNPPQPNDNSNLFSEYDFNLHILLTQYSGNPVFTLILNGFRDLIIEKSKIYFNFEETRLHSLAFYRSLLQAAIDINPNEAMFIASKVMSESMNFYSSISEHQRNKNDTRFHISN